jgi:ABC-2 type transport system permease protein
VHAFVSSAVLVGVFLGSKLGPAMGWRDAGRYGPNNLVYYLHPYFTIAIPNIVFTACLFFGLVAVTRNVKVIYTGGIVLFLGYFLSFFFLRNTNNVTVIMLSDPFGMNGIRFATNGSTSIQQNTTTLPINGLFLANRLLWSGIGLAILAYTYFTFSFERFFSGKRDKAKIDEVRSERRAGILKTKPIFGKSYNLRTLINLNKLELGNIVRDNYFWIIVSCGLVFLGIFFWMGTGDNGVPDFPRTVVLLDIFNSAFLFFLFFIIVFYTGETLHRDQATRYAFINDSLPPPNWVLNGSKLITMLVLAACLSFIPLLTGVFIQLLKGFHQFNFPVYFMYILTIILPRLLEMVAFAYVIHTVINNKFAGLGVAIFIWVLLFVAKQSGVFDYNLLLFSYTPDFNVSDMDGLGHMAKPVYWFNTYWLLDSGLLIIIAALFYYRGVTSSFKERLRLVAGRFDARNRIITAAVFSAFLLVGGYIYYNVSYLNVFLLKSEATDRAVIYEKALKRYQMLLLPTVTFIKMNADLYPDRQAEYVKAMVGLTNKTNRPITQMLLDADEISDYSLKINGQSVPYTTPLLYKRAFFSFFGPAKDTAEFRLYQLMHPLAPGDSVTVEVNSSITHTGFQNNLYAANNLRNGTFFTGGLPGLGYDDDDEVSDRNDRKENHLPPKNDEDPAPTDPVGMATLRASKSAGIVNMDVTVSTISGETAVAPGKLVAEWTRRGRSYFHYVQSQPGIYYPFGIVSARYSRMKDSVVLNSGKKVAINLFYDPRHAANLSRFMEAYKTGLVYFSNSFGDYPFDEISLAETSVYSPRMASIPTLDAYSERFAFNADFTKPWEDDYCYAITAQQLAQQWWRFEVAPNATEGSMVIPEGLSLYSALVMDEKKYGRGNMKNILQDQVGFYLAVRGRSEEREHPLVTADQWYEWGGKAGYTLYGLRDLIGEDRLDSALRDFKSAFAFKTEPPYAGSSDLFRYLEKYTPDSMRYYLADTWHKITFYDSKILGVTSGRIGKSGTYKVTLKVNIAKVYSDGKGNYTPAKQMNDYIDIGVFAPIKGNIYGRDETHPLYLQKYRLTAGEHTIVVTVKGKPAYAGIDPYSKLLDRNWGDNTKQIDN